MGLRGAPKKNLGLKLISGTDRPVRRPAKPDIVIQAIDYIPEPPDWMADPHALREWERLCPILVHNKILDELNLSTFAAMCGTYGVVIGMFSGDCDFNPSISAQYLKYCSEFGLTPAARGKLRSNADPAPQNKFAKYKADAAG